MIIFDSNIWIGLYHKEDSLHAKAQKLVQQTLSLVAIPEYVLIEVCTVLTTRLQKQVANLFLDRIHSSENMIILPNDQNLFYSIHDFFRATDFRKLSFTDISLLYLSQSHTIYTFDKKLASAIKKQVG